MARGGLLTRPAEEPLDGRDIDLGAVCGRSDVRYRSNFPIAGTTLVVFVIFASQPETRAYTRTFLTRAAWSEVQVAQRKPWADEVMDAIGRGQSRAPNRPQSQPQGSGREQPGRGPREGSGVGSRGGAGPEGGRDAGRGESGPPSR